MQNNSNSKILKPLIISDLQQLSEEEINDQKEIKDYVKKINEQAKMILKYENELQFLKLKKNSNIEQEKLITKLKEKIKKINIENLELKQKINILENLSIGNLERLGIKINFREEKNSKNKIDLLVELENKNKMLLEYEDLICEFENFKNYIIEKEKNQKIEINDLKNKNQELEKIVFEKDEIIFKFEEKKVFQNSVKFQGEKQLELFNKFIQVQKNKYDFLKDKNLNNFKKFQYFLDIFDNIYYKLFSFSSQNYENEDSSIFKNFLRKINNTIFQIKVIFETFSEDFCNQSNKDIEISLKEYFNELKKEVENLA
jgi:hypothetical protein